MTKIQAEKPLRALSFEDNITAMRLMPRILEVEGITVSDYNLGDPRYVLSTVPSDSTLKEKIITKYQKQKSLWGTHRQATPEIIQSIFDICVDIAVYIQPDFILINGPLPFMNSQALLNHIKNDPNTLNIPLVLVTAENPTKLDDDVQQKAIVFFKPIDTRIFRQKIAELKMSLCTNK